MSEMVKWIDLRGGDGSRLKVGTLDGEDGRQRRYLFVMGLSSESFRWKNAIERLGFAADRRGRYLVREVTGNISHQDFKPVWPNAILAQIPRDQVIFELKQPLRRAREAVGDVQQSQEERELSQDMGSVVRLGRNADGDEVFTNAVSRFVQRESGQKIYETDLLGPATFLRAPDERAFDSCADGLVESLLRGEVQRSDDVDRFAQAVFDRAGPFSQEDYTRIAVAVDAAMVRRLNDTYDTAQDAYGDAQRLYEYLPVHKGRQRGAGAMPLPLAVIAQRLLGDTKEARVLVPNAWDGASFAFMAAGSRIMAFRGDRDLSRGVREVRADDVTWADRFDPGAHRDADALFFNADPDRNQDGERLDYLRALSALRSLKADGRAILVLAGDDPLRPGELSRDARSFFQALGRRYDIESVVELGAELTATLGTRATLRLIALRNRPAGEHSFRSETLPVVHSWDDLKTHVDEAVVVSSLREAESERIDVERLARGNDIQRPYVAFSKVGEARCMVPVNLQAPLQYALSQVESARGPIDGFVEAELGFGSNTLADRLSPEQVDAVGLGLHRMKMGRGIIIGDETGIGKGRTLSAFATWANKNGKKVIFVTDRANLFSDLMRDLRDIGEWSRFRPFIMNADGALVDVFTNEVMNQGVPGAAMAEILDKRKSLSELNADIVFCTYSQVSGEDSPKAEWLLSQADDAFVIVDEAHIAAGSNSNTSMVIAELVNRAWAVAYSSATWAKTSENLHIYSRAFPDSINVASLTATMRTGGEAFSETFSAMLARDGALVRREHDLSKVEFSFEIDHARRERNEALSDQLSAVMAAISYVSGDIGRLLRRLNTQTMNELREARSVHASAAAHVRNEALTQRARAATEAAAAMAEGQNQAPATEPAAQAEPIRKINMFRSSFGAGSMLYQVMRRFLTVLNADHAADLAVKAISENRKPVIVFEDTGETYLKRMIEEATLPGLDGDPDILPTHVRMPTIKDLLLGIVSRLGVVEVKESQVDLTVSDEQGAAEPEGDADEDGVDLDDVLAFAKPTGRKSLSVEDLPGLSPEAQQKYRKGVESILKMINDLPPLPLNAVDVVHARLAEVGIRVGEISGRTFRLEVPEGKREMAVADSGWETIPMKIVRRSKRKTDVNATVFAFNAGDLDALVINRSAATGLSLHSSPRFADVRRRELIEMQIPEDPTNRIQLFGRVNRFDQVVTPRISLASTGIFGEVRQLMMQNKKVARLSANTRSSRDSAVEMKNIIDLLNSVGREACEQYLSDNAGVRSRLGITEVDLDGRVDIADKLTRYLALLSVVEQRMVYEEVYAIYNEILTRYEMLGENPLRPREMDVRAKTVSETVVIGVDMGGQGSAFDGAVTLRELSWEEPKLPPGWLDVVEMVRARRKDLIGSGLLASLPSPKRGYDKLPYGFDSVPSDFYGEEDVPKLTADPDELPVALREIDELKGRPRAYRMGNLPDAMVERIEYQEKSLPKVRVSPDAKQRLVDIMLAKVHSELIASKHATLEEALAATALNAVQRAHAKMLWVEKYLDRLIPGCSVGLPQDLTMTRRERDERKKSLNIAQRQMEQGLYTWGVVVGLKSPPKGREAMIAHWKVSIMIPGRHEPLELSLATLMEGATTSALEAGQNVVSSVIIDESIVDPLDPERAAYSRYEMRRVMQMNSFTRESRRSRQRSALVLDGNMYLASEWAASTRMGSGIIYSDEHGGRHRGILLNEKISNEFSHRRLEEAMPVRLWSRDMVAEFIQRLMADGAPAPNGPGNTFLLPTSFLAAMPAGQADSSKGSRMLVVPGQTVALVVEQSDMARMARALRGYQKSKLRQEHPDFASYEPQRQEQIKGGMVSISTRRKQRGSPAMISISCVRPEDFDQVTELLVLAAGIEIYLPRGSQLGRCAQEVQEAYFQRRRERSADRIVTTDAPRLAPQPAHGADGHGEGQEDQSIQRMREAA